jgi:hypothetical protein
MSLDLDGRIHLRARVEAHSAKAGDSTRVQGDGAARDQQQAKMQNPQGAQAEAHGLTMFQPPKAERLREGAVGTRRQRQSG